MDEDLNISNHMINMTNDITPLELVKLTYGDNVADFNGFPQRIKEVNAVSKRWLRFLNDNFELKRKDVKK